MRRGTRVGQAYIAITADGSGVNEDIVDSVEKAGPDVERAGEDHGERYGDGFSEGFLDRMRGRLPGIRDRIRERMGGAQIGERAGDEAGESFVERMGEKVKNLGDKVAQEFSDRIASNPEQVRRGIDRAFDDDFADRLAERFSSNFINSLEHRLAGSGAASPLGALFERLTREMDDAVSGNGGGGSRGGEKSFGDRIGALFGAGSRNNFFNAFGKSMGALVNIVDRVRIGATSMFKTFTTGFTQAGEGASFLQKVMSGFSSVGSGIGGGLSKGLGSLASSGPAIAAAALVIVGALSALASIIGALIGLVTALASTLVSGLVGALAVAAPAVLAVVTAAGLLTAAFMSMTDAQKAMLKDAFVPLREEMVGIGQIMLRDMVPAFQTWSANLQNALLLAVPVAQQLGTAFATAGNNITKALSGPGFVRLSQMFTTYLPSIIVSLSKALGGFLNGFAGMFAAITPMVSRFAFYLSQVADRFSNWANSAAGQNAIVDFVDRALNSLQSLWNFSKQLFGFLSDVFFSRDAQNAGNTIFDGLARGFREMRDGIQKAIKNGDLKKWFEDAIKFGEGLWEVIKGLYDIFVAFYNSGVLNLIADGFKAWGTMMSWSAKLIGPMVESIGFLISPLIKVADAANAARNAILNLLGAGKSLGPAFPNAGSAATAAAQGGVNGAPIKIPSLPDLKDIGSTALAGTNIKKAKAGAKKFKNPYLAFANQILADAPGIAASIKNALLDIDEQVTKAIRDAAGASGGDSVTSALTNLSESILSSAEQTVNSAQQTLYSAAQSLASASSMKAAKKALAEVKRAQKSVAKAQADQSRIQAVSDLLARQAVQTESNVLALVSGNLSVNATLADFAEARARVSDLITDANAKLSEALQIRDSYSAQIADSIRTFGSLLSAQAQTINGVQQALTSNDIISTLQDRLTKIKKFQENLRLLLAQGISQDVYKQLVEAGVDGGSAYADALVAGGPGAINTVNQLVSDIGETADAVGNQAGVRLYQAGVDGAQALLDGLISLESTLITAGERLGASIAAAVQRGLGTLDISGAGGGTPPPSSTGGGGGGGGYNGGAMLGTPKNPITPTPLSTPNSGRPVAQFIIQTPTQDPHAVAREVWNEIAGRL